MADRPSYEEMRDSPNIEERQTVALENIDKSLRKLNDILATIAKNKK